MISEALRTAADPDIISTTRAALLLGVHADTLRLWAERFSDFPAPVKVNKRVWRWNKQSLIEWMERRRQTATA